MIFTSYLANISKIPEDFIIVFITLYPPKGFILDKKLSKGFYRGFLGKRLVYVNKYLAPTREIFQEYKNTKNWRNYRKSFLLELVKGNMYSSLKNLIKISEKNEKKIVLVCYEKDPNMCHRGLIGEVCRDVYNQEWIELSNNKIKNMTIHLED